MDKLRLERVAKSLERQSLQIGLDGYRGYSPYEKAIVTLYMLTEGTSDVAEGMAIGVAKGEFSQADADRALRLIV